LNDELSSIQKDLENTEVNPRDVKRSLARKLVTMYHNEEAAFEAEREFDNIFINKGIPDDIKEYQVLTNSEILDLIVNVGFAPTKTEARRLITQGGVTLDGKKITDVKEIISIENPSILKVGKRNFIKLIK